MTQPRFFLFAFLSAFIFTSVSGAAPSAAPRVTRAAETAQRDFMRTFESPRIEFLEQNSPFVQPHPGRYPWLVGFVMGKILAHEPETTPRKFSDDCSPDHLQDELTEADSPVRQSQLIDSHFTKCTGEVETGIRGEIPNAWDILRLKLDTKEHPFYQRVVLHLPGGVALKALLALKGDRVKRPFVVVRLGIFSNIEEFIPERFLLMDLFEQGPSNVLVVENSSSADYVADNPGLTLGGPMDGLQNIQIAKMLRSPTEPLSGLVSSLHFVGISLGGNGLFHAAGLETLAKGPPLIDNFVGLCPVVHLQPTLLNGIRPGLEGTAVDWWMSARLKGIRDRVSSLRETRWLDWLKLTPWFWPEAVRFAVASYPATPGLAEGIKTPPEYSKDMWTASDPFSWMKSLKSPFLILATKEDDVVPPDVNSRALVREWKPPGDRLGLSILGEGFHCTLSSAYEWNTIAALMNGSVLSAARNFHPKREKVELDLGDVVPPAANETYTALTYEVLWPDDPQAVSIRVHVVAGGRGADFTSTMSRNDFEFHFLDAQLSEPEKKMLERWLHRNLRLELIPKLKRTFLRLSWPKAA